MLILSKYCALFKTGVTMKRFILAIATAFFMLGLCASASAQYVWLDENNKKHYSDQPPPASVPNKRILKTPRNRPAININESTPTDKASGASTGAAAATKPQAPMSTAEKNADFNKRKMEQAEKDKKADNEKKRADAKAQNCERARSAQRSLSSGERIARMGKSGEREFMGDEERARESQTVQDALKDCN